MPIEKWFAICKLQHHCKKCWFFINILSWFIKQVTRLECSKNSQYHGNNNFIIDIIDSLLKIVTNFLVPIKIRLGANYEIGWTWYKRINKIIMVCIRHGIVERVWFLERIIFNIRGRLPNYYSHAFIRTSHVKRNISAVDRFIYTIIISCDSNMNP